jgi:hypothetical protein
VTVVPAARVPWLRPGQTVDISLIVTNQQARLVVPASALQLADKAAPGGQRTVLVLRDGHAVAVPVTVGSTDGEMVPVLSGLTAEDRVVRDAALVKPGARIRPAGRSGR